MRDRLGRQGGRLVMRSGSAEATLGHAAQRRVARPAYERRAGQEPWHRPYRLGAFHRAHQAVRPTIASGGRPGLGHLAASLRSRRPAMRSAPQEPLHVAVRERRRGALRVVGSITGILVAPEDPAAVLDRLTRPATRIVTITVTGRLLPEPATGALNRQHPGIQHDLQNPGQPRPSPASWSKRSTGAGRRAPRPSPCCPATTCRTTATHRRHPPPFAGLRDPALGKVDRGQRRLPQLHGGPHRSRDHRRGPRDGGSGARVTTVAGHDRAVQPMGDRGRLPRGPAGLGAGRR